MLFPSYCLGEGIDAKRAKGVKLLLSSDVYRSAICAGAEPPIGRKCAVPLPACSGDSVTVTRLCGKIRFVRCSICMSCTLLSCILPVDGRLREELPPATLFPAESPLQCIGPYGCYVPWQTPKVKALMETRRSLLFKHVQACGWRVRNCTPGPGTECGSVLLDREDT